MTTEKSNDPAAMARQLAAHAFEEAARDKAAAEKRDAERIAQEKDRNANLEACFAALREQHEPSGSGSGTIPLTYSYDIANGMVHVTCLGRKKSTQVGGTPPGLMAPTLAREILGEVARDAAAYLAARKAA